MSETPSIPQTETLLNLYFKSVEKLHAMKLEQIRELGSTFAAFGSTATDALSKGIQGINYNFDKQLDHIVALFSEVVDLSPAALKALRGKDELFARALYDDQSKK